VNLVKTRPLQGVLAKKGDNHTGGVQEEANWSNKRKRGCEGQLTPSKGGEKANLGLGGWLNSGENRGQVGRFGLSPLRKSFFRKKEQRRLRVTLETVNEAHDRKTKRSQRKREEDISKAPKPSKGGGGFLLVLCLVGKGRGWVTSIPRKKIIPKQEDYEKGEKKYKAPPVGLGGGRTKHSSVKNHQHNPANKREDTQTQKRNGCQTQFAGGTKREPRKTEGWRGVGEKGGLRGLGEECH